MVIKATFRGIYANPVTSALSFAKLLIQKFYGKIICLANKPYLNLVNGMGLVRVLFVVGLKLFMFRALYLHLKML